ncbi:MAG: DUF6600 domain-containing protein, partial [Mucilaginibacter sp.]
MKSINKLWSIALLALLLISFTPGKSKAQEISSQDFYDNLAPYGTWVYDPTYGNVWIPDTDDDFRPYATQGHWVLTEYGNTWVSDYPWGWATFHYGRWHYDDYYGWEWIPGYEWAPAWVSWRQGRGYYGWAPLMPGISISLSIGGGYNIPDRYWVCAPQAYINRPNIYNYYVPNTRVVNIIHNTTIINNTYVNNNRTYIAGPRAEDIQRVTHQRPQVYRIDNANEPGRGGVRNNSVTMFRPEVRKAPDAHPERVVDGAAYREQNPTQSIARRAPGGGVAFDHNNASKLANTARTATPDNGVVRVNNRPDNNQGEPNRRFGNDQNNRQGQRNNYQQQNNQQVNPATSQPDYRRGNQQDNRQGQPQQNNQQVNPATGQPDYRRGNQQDNRQGQPQQNNQQVNPATGQPDYRRGNQQDNRQGQPQQNNQQVNPATGQ